MEEVARVGRRGRVDGWAGLPGTFLADLTKFADGSRERAFLGYFEDVFQCECKANHLKWQGGSGRWDGR